MDVRKIPARNLPMESAPARGRVVLPPAWSEPGREGRAGPAIRAALRAASLAPPESNPILVEAVLAAISGTPHATKLARAIADCAVTGRLARESFVPAPDLAHRVAREAARRRQLAQPTNAITGAAQDAVARACAVARYLEATESERAPLAPQLGWIGVSSDDDPPHAPVNVPASDLRVRSRKLRVWLEDPPPPPRPRRSVEVALRYALDGPLDGSRPTILFLHGHSSRLEEVEDVLRMLRSTGRYTLIALDLPSSGYSEVVDHLAIAPIDAPGTPLLDFLERTIDAFVRALRRDYGVPTARIDCVAGGSLGGNLSLRLAARHDFDWLGGRFAAWSPACVWKPVGFQPAIERTRRRMMEVELPDSRQRYFQQVFEERVPCIGGQALGMTQPDTWYAPDWAPRQALIDECRAQRRETYHAWFRRWHWRVAFEQLSWSLTHPPRGAPVVDQLRGRKVLLLAGNEDDLEGTNIYSRTADIGAQLRQQSVTGSTLLLDATGHSIHNERPVFLAATLEKFLAGDLDR
jgi:hypothetical protein